MAAVDGSIYIYYAHFIKDFTLTITKSDGTTTVYTKDGLTLNEANDRYELNGIALYGNEKTFTVEGEGFIRQEVQFSGSATTNIYLKPSKLYAYEIDGHSGSYGYLASLPPVVDKSLLYDSNGTFDANPASLDFSAYIYGERLTAVSGDQITVNAYIEPS